MPRAGHHGWNTGPMRSYTNNFILRRIRTKSRFVCAAWGVNQGPTSTVHSHTNHTSNSFMNETTMHITSERGSPPTEGETRRRWPLDRRRSLLAKLHDKTRFPFRPLPKALEVYFWTTMKLLLYAEAHKRGPEARPRGKRADNRHPYLNQDSEEKPRNGVKNYKITISATIDRSWVILYTVSAERSSEKLYIGTQRAGHCCPYHYYYYCHHQFCLVIQLALMCLAYGFHHAQSSTREWSGK